MLTDVVHRLRSLFNRARVERDVDDELRFHLERQIDSYERAGVDHGEAVRRARLEFGGADQIKEEYRDALGVRTVDNAVRDVRLAVRSLIATPIVSTVAVLSVALAIGANTAIFSILNSLLLRALPVREPARLVLVSDSVATRLRVWSYPVWTELHRRSDLFDASAAWSAFRFNVAPSGESHFVAGVYASGSFFDTLGVRAVLGRTFTEADDRRGGGPDGPVAVISYGFWQRQFGGAADVIGRSQTIEGVPFTIVGITPPDFFGAEVGRTFDVIVPFSAEPLIRGADSFLDEEGSSWIRIIARLRPAQSAADATTALRTIQPRIRDATIGKLSQLKETADRYLRSPFTVIEAATGHSELRGAYRRPLLTIMAVVSIVLLIACVNIANLLLARSIARRHELGVRLAIGASRLRIAQQLAAESLVLSGAGAVLGLAVARWGSRLLVDQLSTGSTKVFLDLAIDGRLLLFTVAVAAATALLFGTLPALRASEVSPTDALKDGSRATASAAQRGVAGWLIAAQAALSVVLLVTAGLFIRSFTALVHRQLGFQADQVLVVTVDPHQAIVEPAARVREYEGVRDTIGALPDVADAALSMVIPFGGLAYAPRIDISGVRVPDAPLEILGNVIDARWLQTVGTPLVDGRAFTAADRAGAPRVALVNETLARRILGGRPFGHTITLYPHTPIETPPMEIVGVVADTVWSPRDAAPAMWYAPADQFDATRQDGFVTGRISVRAKYGSPLMLTRSIAEAIAAVNPRLSVTFRPLAAQVNDALVQERLMAALAGAFGVLALLLAGLGLYGVTAYAVNRRRSEIGIRIALGASAASVARLVLARVAVLVGAGGVLGAAVSVWGGRFVSALVYGVAPHDPATVAAAVAILYMTALMAAWLPARRAARIDPMTVLRES